MPRQPDNNLEGLKSIDAIGAAIDAGEKGIKQMIACIRYDLKCRASAVKDRDAAAETTATGPNIERHARHERDIRYWGDKAKRDADAAIESVRKMHADLVHLQHSIDASDSL